jgi:hypothetical protein
MKTETVEGDPRVTFKVGETTYIVDFFGCEDKVKGCKMLQYAILFEPDAADTVEKVNSFNYEFIFGKAALHKTEGLLSTRAVVGSAGSSKRHLLLEFGAFNAATSALLEHMKAPTVAQAPATGAPAAATLSLSSAADTVRAPARWKSMPKTKR